MITSKRLHIVDIHTREQLLSFFLAMCLCNMRIFPRICKTMCAAADSRLTDVSVPHDLRISLLSLDMNRGENEFVI